MSADSGPVGRFSERPLLVFWETTKACPLSCRHCRASARVTRDPAELDTTEGMALIEQLAGPARPRTTLILTGGDCLMRPDLFDLLEHARRHELSIAVSPSVSPMLDTIAMDRLRAAGVRSISISLDGARSDTHDGVRGIGGHYGATVETVHQLATRGFHVQVNTTVMPANVEELADVAAQLHGLGVTTWEVFFLITTGRGSQLAELSPAENNDVCHFLVDAARYGITVRTVEAPFFRRVRRRRRDHGDGDPTEAFDLSPLYTRLYTRLVAQLGPPRLPVDAPTVSTRDGNGVVFIAHDGAVYPSGFLPIPVGNIRDKPLLDIYRESPLLRSLRAGDFEGPCGSCEDRLLCGGSRARAYSHGNVLASDAGCVLVSGPPARV